MSLFSGGPSIHTEPGAVLRGSEYTAAAALFAAFVGLGSAFIAGWLNSEQAEEDFLRSQRTSIYAEFIANANAAYYAMEADVAKPVDEGQPAPEIRNPSREELEAYEALYIKLDGTMDQVSILGSPDTIESANLVMADILDGFRQLVDAAGVNIPTVQRADGVVYCEIDGPCSQDDIQMVNYDFVMYLEHRTAFVNRVREELEVPD